MSREISVFRPVPLVVRTNIVAPANGYGEGRGARLVAYSAVSPVPCGHVGDEVGGIVVRSV